METNKKKEVLVHRVVTSEESETLINHKGEMLNLSTPHRSKGTFFLYFTDKGEIKDNDWFMSAFYGYPLQNTQEWREQQKVLLGEYPDLSDLKHHRIISSTDPKLGVKCICEETCALCIGEIIFPKPSNAFVDKYCEVGGINKVLVDYEIGNYDDWFDNGGSPIWKPTVDPNHNTITVHPLKKCWNRDEVTELIRLAMKHWGGIGGNKDTGTTAFENFIKKHL